MVTPRTTAFALLTLTALFWAGNTIVGRAVAGELPPMGISFWRNLLAFAIILPFGGAEVWRCRALIRREWKILVILSFFAIGLFTMLAFLGLQHTEAVNGALIQGTLPINIILVAWVLTGALITRRQAVGVVLAFFGVVVIVAKGSWTVLAGMSLNLGDPLIWGAVLSHATYTVLLPRRPMELSLYGFLTVLFGIGVVTCLPAYLIETIALDRPMPFNFTAVWAISFVALFCSVLAQQFWATAVKEVGPNMAGYFIYLTPVFATVMAVLLLDEALRPFHAAGIAFIAAGLYLAASRGRRARVSET